MEFKSKEVRYDLSIINSDKTYPFGELHIRNGLAIFSYPNKETGHFERLDIRNAQLESLSGDRIVIQGFKSEKSKSVLQAWFLRRVSDYLTEMGYKELEQYFMNRESANGQV